MELAEWTTQVGPSATLALVARVRAKRADGVHIHDFGAGEPDFPTPPAVLEAAFETARAGATRYTPAAGTPELRRAFAEKIHQIHDLRYDPTSEVAVTAGAKQALFVSLSVVLRPGRCVIVPAPAWVSYAPMVRMAGGRPVAFQCRSEDDYLPDPEALLRLRDETDAVAVVLNSPNNPTGAVYPEEVVRRLAGAAVERDFWIVSDEVYDRLILDKGLRHAPPARFARERTLAAYSCSKTYAMTGWRVGCLCGPREVVRHAANHLAQSTSNVAAPSQQAALFALRNADADADAMRRSYVARRDLICRLLSEAGFRFVRPAATFFLMLDVRPYLGRSTPAGAELATDEDFCSARLEEARTAAVFGSAFGAPGFVRLSFAVSEERIKAGVAALSGFVEGLRG